MKRLIVGFSGASGVIYGIRLLEVLKKINNVKTHLVMSEAAQQTIGIETKRKIKDIQSLADKVYEIRKGELVGTGTYEELMKCSESFNSMVNVKE